MKIKLIAGYIKHLGEIRAVVRSSGNIVWIEPFHSDSHKSALEKAKTKMTELLTQKS